MYFDTFNFFKDLPVFLAFITISSDLQVLATSLECCALLRHCGGLGEVRNSSIH